MIKLEQRVQFTLSRAPGVSYNTKKPLKSQFSHDPKGFLFLLLFICYFYSYFSIASKIVLNRLRFAFSVLLSA